MAAWCLPKNLSKAWSDALDDGRISPEKLMDMTSEERREALADIVGHENAREINAQFESKMLLKDQKRGLTAWARKLRNVSEPARKDIIDKINKMERILNPAEEQAFMEDLAAKRLGISVTSQEAKEIFQLAQKAEAIKQRIITEHGSYRQGTDAEWTVYGKARLDLFDKLNELKPGGSTAMQKVLNVLSLKPMLTSILHWSAPFVQGWGMISTRNWWQGVGKMFQYFASEDNYRDLEGWIVGHPDYEIAKEAKLGLTKLGDKLTEREEGIQSTLLEKGNQWISEKAHFGDYVRGMPGFMKAPLAGDANVIRGWSRSFTGFLNYVRASRYYDLLAAARLKGIDVSVGSKNAEDLATVVGNFTGRGRLGEGDKYAQIAPLLNSIFFAPRKVVATVEMFNPVAYARLSPIARQEAIRQLVGSVLVTGTVLTIAKLVGAEVNNDWRSSDFMKINIGGEKLDMTGGNASYARMWGRLITGQTLSPTGAVSDTIHVHGAEMPVRAGAVAGYMLGKLAPIASLLADAVFGKDPAGRAFNLPDQLREELTPIVINSFLEFAANNPHDTAAIIPSMSAFLGVGLESPLPPLSLNGHDPFGQPLPRPGGYLMPQGTPDSWRNDPVVKEAQSLGVFLGFPGNKIQGVPLTSAQFDQYSVISGRLAHARLEELVRTPGWDTASPTARAKTMKRVIQGARKSAAQAIMSQSQGTSNDIVAKSYAAKIASAP